MYLRSLNRVVIISLLNFYQQYVSRCLPCACRFFPSCSEYAKQAIFKYGLTRGAWMTVRRLFRCHPFSGAHGYDPLK
ncbi:membrane protein insertion efficiency factor YidD [Candidatus Omnitrophota bacterium]